MSVHVYILSLFFQSVSLSYWINPAERLVTRALNKWQSRLMKADNTSAIVVYIDPLGPSKLTLLKKKREEVCLKKQISSPASLAVIRLPINDDAGLQTNSMDDKTVIPVLSTKMSSVGSATTKLTEAQSSVLKAASSGHGKDLAWLQLDDRSQARSSALSQAVSSVPSSSLSSSTNNLEDVVGFAKFDALKIDVKSAENDYFTKERNSSTQQISQNLCLGILQTTRDNAHVNNKKNQASRKSSSDNFGHIFKSTKPFLSLEKVLSVNYGVFHKKDKDVQCKKVSREEKDTNNSSLYKSTGHHLRSEVLPGYAQKTRITLRRAKDAAKRAISLENRLFVQRKKNTRLTRLKRKSTGKAASGPVAKRLRKCDG